MPSDVLFQSEKEINNNSDFPSPPYTMQQQKSAFLPPDGWPTNIPMFYIFIACIKNILHFTSLYNL